MNVRSKPAPLMKEEFESAIDRCGLPLKLDEATRGDGNCWVRAVQQQLERPELRQQLNTRTQEILNVGKEYRHLKLKSYVAEFATTSSHPTVQEAKSRFETEGQGKVEKISWDNHWKTLKKDKEWSDEVMVQATAWFIGVDIQIVYTTGTPDEPFKLVGGNMEEQHKDCAGYPLWIGYKNNIHYQSLLPTDDEVLYPRACRRNNKEETKAQENQSKEKKTKALVDRPIKKITQKNKRPGEETTVSEDPEDQEPVGSSQKRKLSDEPSCSPKKTKVKEKEAFVFEDETKVY